MYLTKMLKKNLKNNILLHTFWFPLYVWFGGFNLSCVYTLKKMSFSSFFSKKKVQRIKEYLKAFT